jgi:predicted restriction endonuclease
MSQGKEFTKEADFTGVPCLVCGFSRTTERCHLIPKRFLFGLRDFKKLADFSTDNKNIVPMCANHHRLYDRYQLDEKELKIVWKYISENLLHEIMHLINSDYKTYKKYKEDSQYKKQSKTFHSWKERFTYFLIRHNLITKNE